MNRFGWLGLAALALVAGCSNGAPTNEDEAESEGEQGQAISAPHTFPNDKAAFDYFLGKGLKDYQAAGIVGNLDQESGMNPAIAQLGGGPGRGIAQWSTGGRWDADKNDNAVAFAAEEKKSVASLGLQLDFIWHELTTFPSYGLAELKSSTDVHDAVIAFQQKFEACGDCVSTNRITYAQNALDAYGGDKVAVSDAGAATVTTVPASDAGETEPPTATTTEDDKGSTAPAPGGQSETIPEEAPSSGGCSAAPKAPFGELPMIGCVLGLALVLRRRR